MSKLEEILNHMGKRPGMYLGTGDAGRSIHVVAAFVMGYGLGKMSPEDQLTFSHFTRWVAAHYGVVDGPRDGFSLILEHVAGDERLACDEFFRLFPAYARDMRELGPEGVHAHFCEVMRGIPDES